MSFFCQMWLPDVMTCTPLARIFSAMSGVRPNPSAAFSPLADHQVGLQPPRQLGSPTKRPCIPAG